MSLYLRCLIQNIFICEFAKTYIVSGRGLRILVSKGCYMSKEVRDEINKRLDDQGKDRMGKEITQIGYDVWVKDFHVNWLGGGITIEDVE